FKTGLGSSGRAIGFRTADVTGPAWTCPAELSTLAAGSTRAGVATAGAGATFAGADGLGATRFGRAPGSVTRTLSAGSDRLSTGDAGGSGFPASRSIAAAV